MFRKKSKNRTLDISPPSGIFVQDPSGKKFYSKSGGLFEVSEIHFPSWSAPALPVHPLAIKGLPLKGKLGFRDGTLVRDFVSGRIYLISDSKRRLISSPSVLEMLSGGREVEAVPSWAVELHLEGEELADS